MYRMIRSRLSIIAMFLIAPIALIGCMTCDECGNFCMNFCSLFGYGGFFMCIPFCSGGLCNPVCLNDGSSQYCAESPGECTAMFEQFQMIAIEFCEEYPEECQQAFEAWVESLDAESEE